MIILDEIKIDDLINLVIASSGDPEAHIQKIFEWQYDRIRVAAQWMLGAAASLLIAAAASVLNARLAAQWWQIILLMLAVLISGLYGILRLRELRTLHRQYLVALRLFSELLTIQPFLRRLRGL